jgi:hypothetical protein
MNQNLIIAALLLYGSMLAYSQTPDQAFDHANQLYQQGKLADARDAYEVILNNGYQSGALYYNLGNVYYKSGNIAKAVLNYERARQLVPDDDDLLHNLQLANLMITDKVEPTPRLFILDYWDGIMDAFSLKRITWLAYFLFLAFVGFHTAAILSRSYQGRRLSILCGAVSGLLFISAGFIFVGKMSTSNRHDTAIVMASITTLKNSPDSKSSDAFVLHSGVKVQITDSVNDWIKIRLADGKVGWMERTAAEII